MKRCLVAIALLGLVGLLTLPAIASAPQVNVTGNVLAESIVMRGNSPQIKGLIAGFKPGTVAAFHSLTTFVIKNQGVYNVRLEINGPDGKPRAYYSAAPINVKEPNTTHFMLTYWPSVNFNTSGIYDFDIRVNNVMINSFSISAN